MGTKKRPKEKQFVLADKTLWSFRIMKCPFEVTKKSLKRPSKRKRIWLTPL